MHKYLPHIFSSQNERSTAPSGYTSLATLNAAVQERRRSRPPHQRREISDHSHTSLRNSGIQLQTDPTAFAYSAALQAATTTVQQARHNEAIAYSTQVSAPLQIPPRPLLKSRAQRSRRDSKADRLHRGATALQPNFAAPPQDSADLPQETTAPQPATDARRQAPPLREGAIPTLEHIHTCSPTYNMHPVLV